MECSLRRLACLAGLLALLPGLTAGVSAQAMHRPPAASPAVLAADPNPGIRNFLKGVRTTSPTDAWAVGYYCSAAGMWKTLILHWNGSTWLKVASPTPGVGPEQAGSLLYQVSADSPADAWAVGSYCVSQCATNSEHDHTMILHWNGTRWSVS